MVAAIVFVIFYHAMDSEIDAENEEEYRADMAEPFLESLHFSCQFGDADSAITDKPSDKHDGQSRSESEDNGHEPVPCVRQRERDINHRQEINESMRAESDSEEDAENEGPEPTLLAIRFFEPFADTVIVLVVMMSAKKEHDTADEHEAGENGFAPMAQQVLNAFGLCAHEERDAE